MKKSFIMFLLISSIIYGISAEPKTIKLISLNRISSEETTYENGKISEVVKKDYGYSDTNLQLIRLTSLKLAKRNFSVHTNNDASTDYTLIFDTNVVVIDKCQYSIVVELKTKDKSYVKIIRSEHSGNVLTDFMSSQIIDFLFQSLSADIKQILFGDSLTSSGSLIVKNEGTELKVSPEESAKVVKKINANEELIYIGLNKNTPDNDFDDYFWVKVQTKDNQIGWIKSTTVM